MAGPSPFPPPAPTPRVKICGVGDFPTALVAAQAGADFLGFVFAPGVRRRIEVEEARDIVRRLQEALGEGMPRPVGVFVDQPPEEVNHIVRRAGLAYAQLCGEEDLEACARIQVPVIRMVPVEEGPREEVLEALDRCLTEVARRGFLPLLDRAGKGPQRGGTGRAFDWTIARDLARRGHRFLLAGGLTPENVGEAVRTVRPYGVDVSSGVEREGVKDPERVRAFLRAAHAAPGLGRSGALGL